MKKGFTLIEMLIASFMIITVVIGMVNIFSSMIRSQKNVLDSQYLIDQGNYIMEYMSKNLRMAKREERESEECLNNKENYQPYLGGVKFIFSNPSNNQLDCKAFFVENGVLYEYQEGRSTENLPLTSSNVNIVDFEIIIEDGENIQPFVKIFFKMKPFGFDSPEIELRTAVSQRDLNFPTN